MSFKISDIRPLFFDQQFRRAKTWLPKEIKDKLEEWKFSSGVMCPVAYQDGENVQSFQ